MSLESFLYHRLTLGYLFIGVVLLLFVVSFVALLFTKIVLYVLFCQKRIKRTRVQKAKIKRREQQQQQLETTEASIVTHEYSSSFINSLGNPRLSATFNPSFSLA